MTSKLSAFFSSAAFFKLNDPVIMTSQCMILILLGKIRWPASLEVSDGDLQKNRYKTDGERTKDPKICSANRKIAISQQQSIESLMCWTTRRGKACTFGPHDTWQVGIGRTAMCIERSASEKNCAMGKIGRGVGVRCMAPHRRRGLNKCVLLRALSRGHEV